MLTYFGAEPKPLAYEPSTSREDDLLAYSRVSASEFCTPPNHPKEEAGRHMHSAFDPTELSAVQSAPDWYTNVFAWNETDQASHQSYIMHEREAMCERRGWHFIVLTEHQHIDDATEFDNGVVRPVPSELHAYVNSQTITLSHKKSTPTKYERVIGILDAYGIVQSIVWQGRRRGRGPEPVLWHRQGY